MSLLKDALHFDKFLTPCIIKWVYYVLSVLLFVVGFGMLVAGPFTNGGIGLSFLGLLNMILGPIFVRIYAELMILAFRAYDKLCEISTNTGKQAASWRARA